MDTSSIAHDFIKKNNDYYKRPRQARGIEKFNIILDALEALIIKKGCADISLYDVIEQAGVSQGSVYHFFPSIQAALAALLARYDLEITQFVEDTFKPEAINNWRDVIRHQAERSREYLNNKPVALILFMGPGQNWETRLIEAEGDYNVSKSMINSIKTFYHVPESPNPSKILLHGVKILDAMWELSFIEHGKITDEYHEETLKAIFAYLSLYWPNEMENINTH